jgi:hypothetical protein
MTAGTEPLTERPAWKALKAHYTLGPPSESSLPMFVRIPGEVARESGVISPAIPI